MQRCSLESEHGMITEIGLQGNIGERVIGLYRDALCYVEVFGGLPTSLYSKQALLALAFHAGI